MFGKASNYLSNYVKRSQVVLNDNQVDLDDPINADFLQSRREILGSFPMSEARAPAKKYEKKIKKDKPAPKAKAPSIKKPVTAPSKAESKVAKEDASLAKRIREADLKKKLLDAEISQNKLNKLLGKSLPTDLVKEVVTQMNKAMTDSMKEAVDSYTDDIAHRTRMSAKDVSQSKKELIAIVNTHSRRAVEKAKRRIEKAIIEMTENEK